LNGPETTAFSQPMKFAKLAMMVLIGSLLAGCVSSYVNLTPRNQPRDPAEVYPFEVQWTNPRSGANNAEVRAYVLIDETLHPLARVPGTENRFEGKVPLPPGRTYVPYRFKFDYHYPGLPQKVLNSDWSPEYRLVVPPGQ
jgi:hypothetical protein